MLRFRLGVVFALLVLAASVAAAPDARAARATQPVPSLAPRDTAAQWTGLVHGHDLRPLSTTAGCRPLHAVFYAATDWLRLATKLAAQASPCAQYSVSIPPLVADKTRPRPDQAWRIRALGPSFHALAEIHLTAWQKWVNAGNGSWYQAGVEARRRMAAAGYDVGAGDTWALNELSSAVRRGDGTWRTDVRELVRGLFDAGGEQPPAPGVVFVVGVGQRVTSVATYKARLQEWLQDSAFWVDMNAYVGDWAQEVYGDVRSYAAPGSSVSQRRDALTDYLDHSDLLARAGGAVSGTASAFFSRTASPLGSAAWQWDGSFGWTLVDAPLMQQFVSTQVYAMRSHDASLGRPDDRWGFAWAPRNPGSVPKNEFASAAGAVLDRLAAAIRDSGGDSPSDPGVLACGPPGKNLWCGGDLAGAALTPSWATFRTWSPTTLTFVTPPPTVVAGAVSTPITIQPQVAGVAARPQAPLAMTITTSSPTGTLATNAAGPFTPSVTVQLVPGAFSTRAGLLRGHDLGNGHAHRERARRRGRDAGADRLGRCCRLAADRARLRDADPRGDRVVQRGGHRRVRKPDSLAVRRLDARAGHAWRTCSDERAVDDVHGVRSDREGAGDRDRHDPDRPPHRNRARRRHAAAGRPGRGDSLRRPAQDAQRLRDRGRRARAPRAQRRRDCVPLPERQALRPRRRAHRRGADDVHPARLVGDVQGGGQEGDRDRAPLEREDAAEPLRPRATEVAPRIRVLRLRGLGAASTPEPRPAANASIMEGLTGAVGLA